MAGLGNPGNRYALNRHNIGFMTVDVLARTMAVETNREHGDARYGAGMVPWLETEGDSRPDPEKSPPARAILVKPMSYMNRSGEPVRALATLTGLPPERLIVIHDDMDLEFGRLKIKTGGGHGGHNGIRSLMEILADGGFIRVRMGIGRPPPETDPVAHVLGDFPLRDRERLSVFLERAARAVITIMTRGITTGMNLFNRNQLE